jgi:hypothetical protein
MQRLVTAAKSSWSQHELGTIKNIFSARNLTSDCYSGTEFNQRLNCNISSPTPFLKEVVLCKISSSFHDNQVMVPIGVLALVSPRQRTVPRARMLIRTNAVCRRILGRHMQPTHFPEWI